jgi:hypothetical protein
VKLESKIVKFDLDVALMQAPKSALLSVKVVLLNVICEAEMKTVEDYEPRVPWFELKLVSMIIRSES